MIVVDTSALMAIIMKEPEAQRCAAILGSEPELVISAGTVAEAMIVAGGRQVAREMERLITGAGLEIAAVTPSLSWRVAAAYARWGKGNHPARLNFGDCFAYAEAEARSCPLLFIGDDFARTDLKSALDG
ncbi:type II toxin-antitoxin system VapC family toxin [Inquilinus limosus]|uniref:Ribonuclease VapC n=1 Tax=Inquilinus limosus TaxID=171674 RepID=A0A211ZGA0_9PROT|nr:type II toxin-antitoxin system VapC family toxin [Inquilinus limosus]OWJ64312.1 VapC toxin family PIN domain ribonuclease [Inquilinus limosus]